MAKTLLEEAIEDARILKQAAIENAKNVLVEAISPNIKQFVESQLGECMPMGDNSMNGGGHDSQQPLILKVMAAPQDESAMYEQPDSENGDQDVQLMKQLGILGGQDSESDDSEGSESDDDGEDKTSFGSDEESGEEEEESDEESESDEEDDEDSKQGMEEIMDMPEGLEMEAKDKKEDKDEDKMDEVVEITNEDLKEALSQVLGSLKKEAKVTKGFGAVQNATLPASGGPGEKGIADEKSGEHHWKDETPPAAKDWTVKEAKQYIKSLMAENAQVKREAAEYKQAFTVLKSKLQEVNLFNSKLLFTQKLLNSSKLNNEQRLGVIETFDRAQSMREVELVYKSLSESFKIAGVLGESKKEQASKAKSSRLSAPSSTMLKEAMVKEEKEAGGSNDFASRMQTLAGLTE
jgi:hypothetical protein